jgi:hypothetical protein
VIFLELHSWAGEDLFYRIPMPPPEFLQNATSWIQSRPGKNSGRENPPISLTLTWMDNLCRPLLENQGKEPLELAEVVLFGAELPFSAETSFEVRSGDTADSIYSRKGTLGAPGLAPNREFIQFRHFDFILVSPNKQKHILIASVSKKQEEGEFLLRLHPPSRFELGWTSPGFSLKGGEKAALPTLFVAAGFDLDHLMAMRRQRQSC